MKFIILSLAALSLQQYVLAANDSTVTALHSHGSERVLTLKYENDCEEMNGGDKCCEGL